MCATRQDWQRRRRKAMKTLARLRWWVLGSLLLLACAGLIWAAYYFGWTGSGFLKKTFWDWLQLLIIPVALAAAALYFNWANTRTERQIARERYEADQQIAKQR